jgi:hypothetical protein
MQIEDVIGGIAGDELVVLAGNAAGEIDIRAVTVIDSWAQVRDCSAGDLIVVPQYFTTAVSGFELDTVVRYAADAGAAGFVFQKGARLPVTVGRLAEQSGVTIFGFSGRSSLVEIVHRLDALTGAGEPSALVRAQSAIATIRRLADSHDHLQLVESVSSVLGGTIATEWLTHAPMDAERLVLNGVPCGWMRATNMDDSATRIVLPYLARVVGDAYAEELNEQVHRDEAENDMLRVLAGESGGPSDAGRPDEGGWLVACLIPMRPENHGSTISAAAEWTVRVAVDRVRRATGRELFAIRYGSDLAVVFQLAKQDNVATSIADLHSIVDALETYRGETYSCGLGSTATDSSGILLSASQARAGAYAARERRSSEIVVSRVDTLDVLLTQAFNSSFARDAIAAILAPFEGLPSPTRATMIETLAAYFDHQGSNARAAAQMHLHPNAVAYRVKKALLHVPLARTDPNYRLALHIACRLELLGPVDNT